MAALPAPPRMDGTDSEGGGVMRNAYEDDTTIGLGIIDAVRDALAGCEGWEVVVVNLFGRRRPFGAGVVEVADKLVLLGIDTDDWVALALKPLAHVLDEQELFIPIRGGGPGALFLVDAQRVIQIVQ